MGDVWKRGRNFERDLNGGKVEKKGHLGEREMNMEKSNWEWERGNQE